MTKKPRSRESSCAGRGRSTEGKYSESNLKQAQELGYKTVFWSLAYVDWYDNDQPTKEEAFEKLLDSFFEEAAWDISSDISVLHNMFAQEGLTESDFDKVKVKR